MRGVPREHVNGIDLGPGMKSVGSSRLIDTTGCPSSRMFSVSVTLVEKMCLWGGDGCPIYQQLEDQ